VEIVELRDHPYFLAVQFHPEFKGRPTRPHPLFYKYVERIIQARTDEERELRGQVAVGHAVGVNGNNGATVHAGAAEA
jgi:hypothetical protein